MVGEDAALADVMNLLQTEPKPVQQVALFQPLPPDLTFLLFASSWPC